MRLIPHSFNGFLFQQNNKVASDWVIKFDWNIQGISTNNIPVSQNFPKYAAKTYAGNVKTITVNFLDVDADKNGLIIAMDVLGENQHKLLAADEFGRVWYINAACVGLNEEVVDGNVASFGVVFEVDDPIWKKNIPSTFQILVNGTGSGTIAPIGNQPALPIITITPTATGSYGFAYRTFIQVINNSPVPLINYPLDITGGGLDTAYLISNGRLLSSGEDLRIYVDGVEVKRWFGGGGINSTTTEVWINWTQPGNTNMTLGTAIAGTGAVGTIQLENTAANIAFMPTIPTTGNVKIGNEIFVYTGVDVALLQLTGVTRAERLSNMGAHSSGDVVYFLTHDVWMYYGSPSIAPYVVDDTNKPMINLTTSTNLSHVYEEFRTIAGLRSGEWSYSQRGNYVYPYTYEQPFTGSNQDPATAIGAFCVINYYGYLANVHWNYYNPCGVTAITASGQKFKYANPYWFLVYLWAFYNSSWNTIWIESSPVSPTTWEPLDSHSAVSLGGTARELLFSFESFAAPTVSNGWCELDAITFDIDSTQIPTIILSAEANNFHLNSVLTNAATGYSIVLDISFATNTPLIVNTREKTITLSDGTNVISALGDFAVRQDWFPLLPSQNNVITIIDAGQVSYDFAWEDRSL